MLNYIWMSLIVIGIGMALASDISDETRNVYHNGESLPAKVKFLSNFNMLEKTSDVSVSFDKETIDKLFGVSVDSSLTLNGKATVTDKSDHYQLFLKINDDAPDIFKTIAAANGKKEDILGELQIVKGLNFTESKAEVKFESVSFLKMKDVTNSALSYAGTAVEIALKLIGIMALWLGVMKIAEEAGIIKFISKLVRPITKFLFPDVPSDHPAIGAMVMNISANMLGLGNAATPFGIKAMEELDKLNPEKGVATNAMCAFLAVNTAGLTLIPATAIAIRAAAGSSDPTIIIGTSIFGASRATVTGVTAAKVFEKFSGGKVNFIDWFKTNVKAIAVFFTVIAGLLALILSGALTALFSGDGILAGELIPKAIRFISVITIPLLIGSFVIYGMAKKVRIYESFVEGAKEGFEIAVKIIPYLVAILVAIGIFRAGGGMDLLVRILSPVTDFIGMPAEVLPMALMRPLSGSGSIGLMTELITEHGADSFIGVLSSTIMGSTETTFYVIAVYFGAVNIRKIRHALAAGLLADLAGILAALFIVKILFL